MNVENDVICAKIAQGGTQFFLVGMCPTSFQKYGLQNRFFLTKQGSWKRFFAKISVFGAEIVPKSETNGPKMKNRKQKE